MARSVLVIHGAGNPRRRRGKVYWEPLLGDALGYRVLAPRMPRPEQPRYWTWARRYLAETVRRPALAGLFLVATPFWGPEFPEFALPPEFGARLRDLSPIYLYHSRDDAELPVEHLERYRRALPRATVRVLEGRGHEFDRAQFPELAADIRGLAPRHAV